jgi:lipid A 4'-phosphatase
MTAYEAQRLIWRQRGGQVWSPEARLLSVYLLSGPASNRIGCFALDITQAQSQTGLLEQQITDIITDFEKDGFVRFDRLTGWIWLPEVLQQQPFADTEEVRRTLPELAALPRECAFHAELTQAFRASADRPGVTSMADATWLTGFLGDGRAAALTKRITEYGDLARRKLPGLPIFNADRIQPFSQKAINLLDYIIRWKNFLIDLINTKPLRILGLLTVIGAILFIVFPGIDIGVAGWFFDPPRDFTLGASWVGRFFDTDVHYGMEWFLVALVCVFIYGLVRHQPIWGLTPKRFLYVALCIALGAGLVTNVIFKDSWGRARPSQVTEFGGPKQFSPPFMRSTQCQKNCSFVSGDASLAASFMSFAVIAASNRRRWWIGLGSFTAIVGLMRMARGSHFLSDVVFAVIFTLMAVFALSRLILEDRWRAWPRWRSSNASLRFDV